MTASKGRAIGRNENQETGEEMTLTLQYCLAKKAQHRKQYLFHCSSSYAEGGLGKTEYSLSERWVSLLDATFPSNSVHGVQQRERDS